MKFLLGLLTLALSLALSNCVPLAKYRFDPSRLSEAELSQIEKVTDDANRKCYPHELGSINFYVDISDKHLGSMETQIINMYAKATNDHLNASNALTYRKRVVSWAKQNLDTINAGFQVGGELEPRHVFVGIKPYNKSEQFWHFTADKNVAGEAPGRLYYTKQNYTHVLQYKAGPETLRNANEFLSNAKQNVPIYHWNANKLRSSNKSLSNCLVFAVDTLRAAGIDTSKIEHYRDPWELAKKMPLKNTQR